jgi:hypothetical protein
MVTQEIISRRCHAFAIGIIRFAAGLVGTRKGG